MLFGPPNKHTHTKLHSTQLVESMFCDIMQCHLMSFVSFVVWCARLMATVQSINIIAFCY